MVTLAMYTLNFFHPGVLLRPEDEDNTASSGLDKAILLEAHTA